MQQRLAEVYRLGAFSCHQLTSPQTHFVLGGKETGLLSVPPPSGEHLHLSWLSLDNLDCVVCACWRGQLPSFQKKKKKSLFPSYPLFFPPCCDLWLIASPAAPLGTGTDLHRGHPRSPESAWVFVCTDRSLMAY